MPAAGVERAQSFAQRLSSPKNVWQKQEKEVGTDRKNKHRALYLTYLWFFSYKINFQAYKLRLRNGKKVVNKYKLIGTLGLILQTSLYLQTLLNCWETEFLTRREYLARSDCWHCLQGAYFSRSRSNLSYLAFYSQLPFRLRTRQVQKKSLTHFHSTI